MFPIWVYALVALLIAAAAFGVAQLAPGMGIFVVLPATFLWIGYNQRRCRKMKPVR